MHLSLSVFQAAKHNWCALDSIIIMWIPLILILMIMMMMMMMMLMVMMMMMITNFDLHGRLYNFPQSKFEHDICSCLCGPNCPNQGGRNQSQKFSLLKIPNCKLAKQMHILNFILVIAGSLHEQANTMRELF